MSDAIAIVCMRLEDGTGYVSPGSSTVACSYCGAACSISPASKAQWLGDRPDEEHVVVCNRCVPGLMQDSDEIAIPSEEVVSEIVAGLSVLDMLDKES